MDMLNNIGRKVAKTAKNITQRSENMVELTKLNLTIGNEEEKVKRMLYEIGSELYRGYTNGSSCGEFFEKQCSEVKKLEDNIKLLKEKVLLLKGNKICSNCKSIVASEVNYCPSCGEKLEEKALEEKPEE